MTEPKKPSVQARELHEKAITDKFMADAIADGRVTGGGDRWFITISPEKPLTLGEAYRLLTGAP